MQKGTLSSKVYSIIVTYNGEETILKSITSLVNSDIIDHKILVFDNNSSDSTVSLIKSNFPMVKVISSTENLGYGNANNLGFTLGLNNGADYFFLLDQDAWIESDTLSKLIHASKENKQFGVFAPLQLTVEGEFDSQFAKYYENSSVINSQIRECKFVNSAAWLITKDCILQTGGFSPIFFHFGVENDYARRARYHDFKIGIVTSTRYIHDRLKRVSRNLEPSSQIHHAYVNQLATLVDINRGLHFQYAGQYYKIFRKVFYKSKGNEHISKISFIRGSFKAQADFLKILKFRRKSKGVMPYIVKE
tara:strand:- start:89399 stop:90313 length:915 start_codon:yes stop_codon:yes gene_type:complete